MNVQNPTAPVPQAAKPPAMTEVNVPLQVPADMMQVDPKTGRMPIDDFQVQLLPKDAIITNQGEVQKLVAQIKDETLPEGMVPKLADSPAGAKVARAKAAVGSLGQMAGGIGVYNLAGWGSWGLSASLAGNLAGVGGAIGLLTNVDGLKDAMDAKHFYEELKAKGTTSIPMQAPVVNEEGKTVMGIREVPVDDIISGAKDRAIMSSIGIASSGLMIAAALGAPPLFAVGAVVMGLGSVMFGMKGLFKALGSKIAGKVKGMFGKDDEAPKAAKPQTVPANAPEVAKAKDATAPAQELPAQAAAPAQPVGLSDEQIQQASARVAQLQAELMANPEIAGTLQKMQELMPAALQNPQGAEAQEYQKVEQGLKDHPSAGAAYNELVEVQTALLSDPRVQQMMYEQQVAAMAAQGQQA